MMGTKRQQISAGFILDLQEAHQQRGQEIPGPPIKQTQVQNPGPKVSPILCALNHYHARDMTLMITVFYILRNFTIAVSSTGQKIRFRKPDREIESSTIRWRITASTSIAEFLVKRQAGAQPRAGQFGRPRRYS